MSKEEKIKKVLYLSCLLFLLIVSSVLTVSASDLPFTLNCPASVRAGESFAVSAVAENTFLNSFSFRWDFDGRDGQNSFADYLGDQVSHSYSKPGEYLVLAQGTDSFGLNYCGQCQISVSNPELRGQIKIFEIFPNPVGADNARKPGGEWVGLYNNSDFYVDLTGWVLYDDDDTHELFITTENTTGLENSNRLLIPPRQKITVFRDGDSDFSLNNEGDNLRLYSGPIEMAGELENEIIYGSTKEGKKYQRNFDTGEWEETEIVVAGDNGPDWATGEMEGYCTVGAGLVPAQDGNTNGNADANNTNSNANVDNTNSNLENINNNLNADADNTNTNDSLSTPSAEDGHSPSSEGEKNSNTNITIDNNTSTDSPVSSVKTGLRPVYSSEESSPSDGAGEALASSIGMTEILIPATQSRDDNSNFNANNSTAKSLRILSPASRSQDDKQPKIVVKNYPKKNIFINYKADISENLAENNNQNLAEKNIKDDSQATQQTQTLIATKGVEKSPWRFWYALWYSWFFRWIIVPWLVLWASIFGWLFWRKKRV